LFSNITAPSLRVPKNLPSDPVCYFGKPAASSFEDVSLKDKFLVSDPLPH
jgi:hypothetical protein